MDWIKVTPETMPPDMEPVIVTVEEGGKKYTIADVRYNPDCGWMVLSDCSGSCCSTLKEVKEDGYWEWIGNCKVTHWMPYPDPAED